MYTRNGGATSQQGDFASDGLVRFDESDERISQQPPQAAVY